MKRIILLVVMIIGIGLSGCATSANSLDNAASKGVESGVEYGVSGAVQSTIGRLAIIPFL